MRSILKRRRLFASTPYADILATSPDFFAGLKYATVGPQQVLWQDAAGTATPVTKIGDPVACVRHPVTGAIMLTQSTIAKRPTWGGPEVGLIFNGSTTCMEGVSAPLSGDFSIWVMVSDLDQTVGTFQFLTDGGADIPFGFTSRSIGRIYAQRSIAGVLAGAQIDEEFSPPGLVGAKYVGGDTTVIRVDGTASTNSVGAVVGVNSGNLRIGARKAPDNAYCACNIKWIAMYNRATTAEEETILRGAA